MNQSTNPTKKWNWRAITKLVAIEKSQILLLPTVSNMNHSILSLSMTKGSTFTVDENNYLCTQIKYNFWYSIKMVIQHSFNFAIAKVVALNLFASFFVSDWPLIHWFFSFISPQKLSLSPVIICKRWWKEKENLLR